MTRKEKLTGLTVKDNGRYVKTITFPCRKNLLEGYVYDGLRDVGEIDESIIDGHEMINGVTVTEYAVRVYILYKRHFTDDYCHDPMSVDYTRKPEKTEIWINKAELDFLHKRGVLLDDGRYYFETKELAEKSISWGCVQFK